jgi:hypothetical protein
MAVTEIEIRQQEAERDNIQRVVSSLETAVAVSSPASRAALKISLDNARAHLGVVEKKIHDAHEEQQHAIQERVALAEIEAERETKLNAEEKKTFGSFLKEQFFTKKDFPRLEAFYAKSWDRLSQHGKDEMSSRIWGGIRRDEFRFEDLPAAVREKEAKQAYRFLNDPKINDARVSDIPEKDRQDFNRAYEAGQKAEAEKVLDRKIFKESMFNAPASAVRTHSAAGIGEEATKASVAAITAEKSRAMRPSQSPEGAGNGDLDISKFELSGTALVDVESQGTSAEIPNARLAGQPTGRSTPGS